MENRYAYDAFGNLLGQEEAFPNRILYAGQLYDQKTDQYYLRARYYNPTIGRFSQEDTYWGDGLNLYAYCANNPVRYFDPSGHQKKPNCPGTEGEAATDKQPGVEIESGSKSISQVDRIKIDAWDYTPDDELYLKYKDVFDNPKYYNQETGAINWPENNGFADMPMDEVLQPGARIDRYGSDYGSFTSPEGTPYEMRAVAPGTDQRPYSVFEVVEPIDVKSGSIASWFDEPGGGIQYLLPDTVDELLDAGILRRIQ